MNRKYSTVIVEDEGAARKRLLRLLTPFSEIIEVIGEADNGISGTELIDNLKPDLIFLDIQMPGKDGFELLKATQHKPYIIFTTAYDNFAIKAFEQNSIAYLLKPIEEEKLKMAIDKLVSFSKPSNIDEKVIELLNDKLETKKAINSISAKVGDRIYLIKLDDTLFFEAKDKYVFLSNAQEKEFILSQTLNQLEDDLPDNFLRINRSVIINTDHIQEIRKYFKGRLLFKMGSSSEFVSGDAYKDSIKTKLNL